MALHAAQLTLECTKWFDSYTSTGDNTLLTEAQVERSFRKLLKDEELNTATFERADELLEDLRPESPLRHRLGGELDELRELNAVN